MKHTIRILIVSAVMACTAISLYAQVDGIGLRTQLPAWAMLSPGLGADISWNGRYMATAYGNYGDWGFSKGSDTKAIRLSTAGIDVRRYFSAGEERWFNPNGGNYFGMYLGVAGRYINFDNRLFGDNSQGDIWTVGPIVGYTFHMRCNWAFDASFGLGYCYDDYSHYKWYPPLNEYRYLRKKRGGRFGFTDFNAAITYRFKL